MNSDMTDLYRKDSLSYQLFSVKKYQQDGLLSSYVMVTVSKSGNETAIYWESVLGVNEVQTSFSNIHAEYSSCCIGKKDACKIFMHGPA